jgi:hypothetical protein
VQRRRLNCTHFRLDLQLLFVGELLLHNSSELLAAIFCFCCDLSRSESRLIAPFYLFLHFVLESFCVGSLTVSRVNFFELSGQNQGFGGSFVVELRRARVALFGRGFVHPTRLTLSVDACVLRHLSEK